MLLLPGALPELTKFCHLHGLRFEQYEKEGGEHHLGGGVGDGRSADHLYYAITLGGADSGDTSLSLMREDGAPHPSKETGLLEFHDGASSSITSAITRDLISR